MLQFILYYILYFNLYALLLAGIIQFMSVCLIPLKYIAYVFTWNFIKLTEAV